MVGTSLPAEETITKFVFLRVDDVQLPSVHAKKAFIISALEKEIRLSFAQRIRGTLPEPYQALISKAKEQDTPDFKYATDGISSPFPLKLPFLDSLSPTPSRHPLRASSPRDSPPPPHQSRRRGHPRTSHGNPRTRSCSRHCGPLPPLHRRQRHRHHLSRLEIALARNLARRPLQGAPARHRNDL